MRGYMQTTQKVMLFFFTFILCSSADFYNDQKGTRMPQDKKPLYLVDASGFLYRSYYGTRPLHTSKGIPIQAVYSFCRMINKLSNQFSPSHMALVWDSKGKTTRHEMFADYKATRQEAPSDLFMQKKYIQQFADLIGLKQVAQQGYEADDLLYSLAKDYEKACQPVVLITSDKDMAQLISDLVIIYDPFKDHFVTLEAFEEKMGFAVNKLPFYFALLGDTSDNIPGVRGIGKKGATELVQQFESLEDLYANLELVSKLRTKKALEEQKSNAFLSRDLFLLQYVPLNTLLEEFDFDRDANWANALPLFKELEFKSMIKAIESKAGARKPKVVKLTDVTDYQMITVTTQEQLDELCRNIIKKGVVAVDVELDGLRPLESTVVGLCVGYQKGTAYYIPFGHYVDEIQLKPETVFEAFKPIFADPAIKKVMHHAKFDQEALLQHGLVVNNLSFDTLIAASLVTEDWQRIGLKKLSEYYLNEPMLTFQEVVKDNGYKNFSYVPLELATEYAAADAHQTLQLVPIFEQMLKDQEMEKLYYSIDLPIVNILLEMERRGIYCDVAVLDELDKKVTQDLMLIKQKILGLIGDEFKDINLNSPKQLEQLLFVHLQLPPQKKSAKRTGYSTDIEVLNELAKLHPIPGLIAKYRELYKLKSTYIDALPRCINKKTGRIHTNYNQTGVATGRLASSDPNLQNIPLNTSYDIHVRSAFKPIEGNVFLSCDYSQIELRVLAYLSQDKALLEAFEQNRDIHAQTASKLFKVPPEDVSTS